MYLLFHSNHMLHHKYAGLTQPPSLYLYLPSIIQNPILTPTCKKRKAQVSIFNYILFVVRLSLAVRKFFTLSTSSEPLGHFQPNLAPIGKEE